MRLWVDDLRNPPSWYDVWAKSAEDAIDIIKRGDISAISLDHDLADGKDGIAVANWLEEAVITGTLRGCPKVQIHSANPVGVSNIINALKKITDCYAIDPYTILGTQSDNFGKGFVCFVE
jgi:hypothetical protein